MRRDRDIRALRAFDDAFGAPTVGDRRSFLHVALSAAGRRARAVFRVLAAAAIGGMLVTHVGDNPGAGATIVPLLAGAYILGTTVIGWPQGGPDRPHARSRRSDALRAVLDVVVVCAVAASINEPRVTVLLVLCAIPLGYGLTLPASAIAMLTAVAVTGCLIVWGTTGVLGTSSLDEGSLLLLSFALSWCGLVACLIAVERERRAHRITKLSESVRDMLRQALRAEANERARVADLLHDDVLQLLLASRHDISDAIDGDLDLLPDARSGIEAATRRLRETIVALRDEGTGDQPLSVALRGLTDDPTRTGPVDVELDGALEDERHPVLVGAVRDVLRDAGTSSAGTTVAVRATREGDSVVVVVQHDDRRHALGLDVSDEAAEILADVTARITALDGTLEVQHNSSGVRSVTIRVPVLASPGDAAASVLMRSRETALPFPTSQKVS